MAPDLFKTLIDAGVGGALAALILFLTYKLVSRLLMTVGLKIAGSLQAQAEALTKQSVSMESLAKSIQEFCSRDNNEHREIILLLKYISKRTDAIKEQSDARSETLDEIRKKMDDGQKERQETKKEIRGDT
jgi:hypothetical protein